MKRNPKAGITQLELMVSLVIMTLITVLVANAFDFNRRSLSISRNMSADTSYFINQVSYRKWLEDLPLDYDGQTGLEYFEGHSDFLRFRTKPTDGVFGSGTTAEVSLRLAQNGSQSTLVAEGTSLIANGTSSEQAIRRTLDTDLRSLSISYFGRVGSEQTKRWHEEWHDPTFIPDLVKLEWETDKGLRPPLTIVPGLSERQRFMSRSSLVPPG